MVCMRWPNQPNWLVLCGAFLLHAGIKGQQPPAAVQADVRKGIDALERSNFSSAEEHLSRALEADPNLSEVRANLVLLEPYDAGVYHGAQAIGHARVVSPVQLYLDLMAQHSRGEDAADFLLDQVIRKQWNAA